MIRKRTKIVATISSLNCTEELIRALYQAGMDVARINTAHCSTDDAARVIQIIRKVSDRIAILIDTKGPNIRTCNLDQELQLKTGDPVTVGPGGDVEVNYARFVPEIGTAKRIVIDDGEMELEILGTEGALLRCKAMNDGALRNHKSVNVPDTEMKTPPLTEKDMDFIRFAAEQKLDFIAHSFVRNRADVLAVRNELNKYDSKIEIIAKIENREGVNHLKEILETADGLMVARGDLGIEIPLEEVPIIQKEMIRMCMAHAKPVITATQMLQSMIVSPRPTRAEVSDVANAVLDGTDAVMLSGETAQGKYPVKAVEMMTRIIQETEHSGTVHFARPADSSAFGTPVTSFLVESACNAAKSLPVRAIICNTATGKTCRMFAARRGTSPVFGLSYDASVVRRMALLYGIYPLKSEYLKSSDELLRTSVRNLLADGLIQKEDLIVLLGRYNGADLCSIFHPADFAR